MRIDLERLLKDKPDVKCAGCGKVIKPDASLAAYCGNTFIGFLCKKRCVYWARSCDGGMAYIRTHMTIRNKGMNTEERFHDMSDNHLDTVPEEYLSDE